jgi:hypothetical protein
MLSADANAAPGLPIAAQYTVKKASRQLRALSGVLGTASSISLFAPVGSTSVKSRVIPRRKAVLE